jgi:hypothetical protein
MGLLYLYFHLYHTENPDTPNHVADTLNSGIPKMVSIYNLIIVVYRENC